MAAVLERQAFVTSRLLEFFSEKELQLQIGHPPAHWPLALTKELLDNALDACEQAGVAPEIVVRVDGQEGEGRSVAVFDNGPGLPERVLAQALDYAVRVSTNAYYVSPTRGQLGNALKCVWAAPYVLDGERGRTDVVTGEGWHRIEVSLDRLAQRPDIRRTVHQEGLVKNGTLIRMHWPERASVPANKRGDAFYNLLWNYAGLNPHATFHYVLGGEEVETFEATAPEWAKWRPRSPTAPAWYDGDRLRALLGAYVAAERDGGKAHTVRSFLAEFAGLSSTAKQKAITDEMGLSGAYLRDLVRDGRELDARAVTRLLWAMQSEAREVKPAALGTIGEEHLCAWMADRGVERDSIKYKRVVGTTHDPRRLQRLPFVVEAVLGVNRAEYADVPRRVVAGINWSPGLPGARFPVPELAGLLGEAQAQPDDPIAVVLHVACPLPGTADRGKTTVVLPGETLSAIGRALAAVTQRWTAAKRRHARAGQLRERELEELRRARRRQDVTVKEAAWLVMEQAYHQARGGLKGAEARQIMYAARPKVLKLTEHNQGTKLWKDSQYFTQTLLPEYMDAHPEKTRDWNVWFDDRGHLTEPHTGKRLGLGTLSVRQYVAQWTAEVPEDEKPVLDLACPTAGPANRYKFALFVEKEGFDPVIEAAQIAQRFDVAPMSTKGFPPTAARELVDELSRVGVTVLVLHDFDQAGLAILHWLQTDNHRYRYRHDPKVVDLGFRLDDVPGLETEEVSYRGKEAPWVKLQEYGATLDEIRFLWPARPSPPDRNGVRNWDGRRVELNAMIPASRFVEWLEDKLVEVGATKVVPEDDDVLEAAYRRVRRRVAIQRAIDRFVAEYDDDAVSVPDGLRERITEHLDEDAAKSWDTALAEIAADDAQEEAAE